MWVITCGKNILPTFPGACKQGAISPANPIWTAGGGQPIGRVHTRRINVEASFPAPCGPAACGQSAGWTATQVGLRTNRFLGQCHFAFRFVPAFRCVVLRGLGRSACCNCAILRARWPASICV